MSTTVRPAGTDLVPAGPVDWYGRARTAVDAWLEEFDSQNTRDGYRGDLNLWLGRCAETGLNPFTVHRPTYVAQWLADRDRRGDSEGTRARRRYALSSWYEWLLDNDTPGVVRNPARFARGKGPRFRTPGTTGTALSREQAEALLRAADGWPRRQTRLRVAAIIAVMLYCGLRAAEVVDLDDESIGSHDGEPVLTVVGKGNKTRRVVLPAPAAARIDNYRAHRDRVHGRRLPALQVGARRALFVTRTGARLDDSTISPLVRMLGVRIGLPALAAHDLRRTSITLKLAAGADLHLTAAEAGHASINTTAGYRRNADHLDPAVAPALRIHLNVPTPTTEDP